MQQAVANGICQGGVADCRVPVFDGTLAGDDDSPGIITAFGDLQDIAAFPL
jgi:hypothetical protein